MSKVKLLLDVVQDMRSLADGLQTIADSLQCNTPGQTTDTPKATEVTPPKPPTPKITIDRLRAVLAEKSGEGKTAQVKALLNKYDAGKLSGVKPEDYAALMEEAKKL